MAQVFSDDAIPTRSGGSELIDYSLVESDRKLILERRKIQLLPDRGSAAYNANTQDTITLTISPGSQDEWLDGRSSYLTATVAISGIGSETLYLPNGPAACFSQVQVISASGQQLVNILDYASIQQLFTEWTTCPTWKHGIGQMYGTGSDDFDDWRPAQYVPAAKVGIGSGAVGTGTYTLPTGTYSAFTTNGVPTGVAVDSTNNLVEVRPAGKSLALQQNIAQGGVTLAFRLDLAWIFANPTLIPSQYFPLTLRATLAPVTQSLCYIGGGGLEGSEGPYSIMATNTPVPGITRGSNAVTPSSNINLSFSNVKFMAALCRVSPTFRQKVDSEMSNNTFQMTVTNYYTSLGTISGGENAQINTTFSAHDCQAFWVALQQQSLDNTLTFNWANRWGGGATVQDTAQNSVISSQLLLNGRYWPPQANTNTIDMFHDTLASFATHAENVDFSPISYYSYLNKNFVLGTLLDRDSGSSMTGVSSVSSPVWTWMPYFSNKNSPAGVPGLMNAHTCIAYTQVLRVNKDGQLTIFQ